MISELIGDKSSSQEERAIIDKRIAVNFGNRFLIFMCNFVCYTNTFDW